MDEIAAHSFAKRLSPFEAAVVVQLSRTAEKFAAGVLHAQHVIQGEALVPWLDEQVDIALVVGAVPRDGSEQVQARYPEPIQVDTVLPEDS